MRTFVPALILGLLLTATSVSAKKLQGVELPDTRQIEGETLSLTGLGLRKVAIVKVYVAGLYVPQAGKTGEEILAEDTLRHTEMHWLRGGGKDRICGGWYDGLADNTPDASAALEAQFDTLCSYMQDAEKGDVFTFTYVPGTGTHVKINDAVKGTLEGKAFADALFASWIGPKPGPGERFKKDILGQ